MFKPATKSDCDLVKACIAKDLRAWSMLVEKYSRLVYAAIENRLKKYSIKIPSQDIEDIRQEIFTMIWREDKLKSIKNTDNIAYWIAIVAGNTAMAHMRKPETINFRNSLTIDDADDDNIVCALSDASAALPDEFAKNKETQDRIDRALDSLPSKEKLVMKLLLFHNKKHREIAEILSVPESTVSSHAKRAKEKMRRWLKDIKT